jgi:hypothetical protein
LLRIDAAFLADVHLDRLPREEANLMLKYVYETLEMRVGIRLADRMDDRELDEFEALVEQQDDDAAFEWLANAVPNYKDIVRGELDRLRVEIRQVAPVILAKSGIVG